MVVVELAQEIAAQVPPQRPLDKGQILRVVRLAKGHAQETLEAIDDVILEPFAVQDREHVVAVRHEGDGGCTVVRDANRFG
jgi:hypothetical protein